MSHFLSECSPRCPLLSLSYTRLRLSACPERLLEEYSGTDTYTHGVRGGMEYGRRIHDLFRDDTIIGGLFPQARRIEFEKELRIPHKSGPVLHGFIDCVVEDDGKIHVLELKTGYVREHARGQLAWYVSLLLLSCGADPLRIDGSLVLYSARDGFMLHPVEISPLNIDAVAARYIGRMDLAGCEYVHTAI